MDGFKLNIEKAKATILYITKQLDNADFLKVFKILYFAEREHLATYGGPIVGDIYIAMRRGPVPSFIYDALKYLRGEGCYNPAYDSFIRALAITDHFHLIANENPDLEELSRSEILCLDKSILENKYIDFEPLSEKSHDLAWNEASCDDEMDYLKIAKAGGASDTILKYIEESRENYNIVFA